MVYFAIGNISTRSDGFQNPRATLLAHAVEDSSIALVHETNPGVIDLIGLHAFFRNGREHVVGRHSLRMTRRCQVGDVGWRADGGKSFDEREMRGVAVAKIGCERVRWDGVRVTGKTTRGGGSRSFKAI